MVVVAMIFFAPKAEDVKGWLLIGREKTEKATSKKAPVRPPQPQRFLALGRVDR